MIDENKATEKIKQVTLRVIILLAVFAALLVAFIFLTREVLVEEERAFDTVVHRYFEQYRSPDITPIVEFLTFFGSTPFLFPAYILVVAYFIFFKKNTKTTWNIIAIGITSDLLLRLMKNLIRRPRPENPLTDNFSGFSYPSGHSFSIFIFCGILIYILWESEMKQVWKWPMMILFFFLAVSVAVSRVYLNVHYASDVVAGFILAVIWLMISIYLLNKIHIKRSGKRTVTSE